MNQSSDGGPLGRQYPQKVIQRSRADASKDVSTTSNAYQTMLPRWARINALEGGTDTMRALGQAYLPQHANEAKDAYHERLSVATLLNLTSFTLNHLTGKAFREPPVLAEEAPQPIVDFVEDVDGSGSGLAVFAAKWFREALAKGFCHVLVDFSKITTPQDDKPRTKADDTRENVRPFWVLVSPENLIFAHADLIDGREVYTHVRLKETAIELDGYAEVVRERIRVIEPGRWQLFQLDKSVKSKDKWVLIDEGTLSLDYIPMVTFYTARDGVCLARPPLDDLAHLNITHFQSSSEQRTILSVARFPILAVSGAPSDDGATAEQPLVIGPKRWLSTADSAGKFYYVEHTGAAINAGRDDLKDLEEQMSMYGAEFLKTRPGSITATGRALDSSESVSPLQAMGVDFKDSLEVALKFTADWLKVKEDISIVFEVENDLEGADGKDLDILDKARARKDISRVAYIGELKRRSILDEDYDPEDDADLIEDEVQSEGALAGANALLAAGPGATQPLAKPKPVVPPAKPKPKVAPKA